MDNEKGRQESKKINTAYSIIGGIVIAVGVGLYIYWYYTEFLSGELTQRNIWPGIGFKFSF
jgi:hypothetical protein